MVTRLYALCMVTVAVLLCCFCLSGCGPAEPTAMRLPPTDSPVALAATHTPVPPTDTAAPRTATATTTPQPSDAPAPTVTAPPARPPTSTPEGYEGLRLTTSDGIALAASLYRPAGSAEQPLAAVLAHEGGKSQRSWRDFAPLLAGRGFTVLTFDHRGCGQSEGTQDLTAVSLDIEAAVQALNDQGFERVACMGASMGGTACFLAAVDTELAGLVMLSSPPHHPGPVPVSSSELASMGFPKMFIVAEEDRVELHNPGFVVSVRKLAHDAPEPKELVVYPGRSHGTELLRDANGEDLRARLIGFLEGLGSQAPLLLEKSPQEFPSTETFQVGLGDLDGDGDLDAVFANMGANYSQVWLNDGTGGFGDPVQRLTQQGHGVGVGDLDGDGDLDLFMTCASFRGGGGYSTKPSLVYLNDGTGTFEESGQDLGDTELSGNGVNLIDLDGDGDLDAHVVYYEVDGMPDKVYLNDGQARFTDSGLALDAETVAWGDLDGDGDLDLFVGSFRGPAHIWLNVHPAPAPLAPASTPTPTPIPEPTDVLTPIPTMSRPATVAMLEGTTGPIYSLDWSPSGQTIASAGYAQVNLWDVESDLERTVLEGHDGFVWGLAWSPDGQTLASASDDESVALWDAGSGKLSRRMDTASAAFCVSWSPDGARLAAGTWSGAIHVWDVASRAELYRSSATALIISIDWSPNGQTLATGAWDGRIDLWDADTGQHLQTI